MNKTLKISIPILIVVIISVITTTVIMNNNKPQIDPNLTPNSNEQNEEPMNKIYATINNQKLEINLEDNSTAQALKSMLPLNLEMADLNNNEKYTYLDKSLPTNTYAPKHIETGDVMLYGNNCLVIFYESFDTNFEYSPIGHIDNLPSLDTDEITVNLTAE